MERMGMQVEAVSDVEQVVIKTTTREYVIDRPEVTLTRIQGQDIYQVMGGMISEKNIVSIEVHTSEEDIALVAQQSQSSLEAARKALEETKGDLAQAIILLAQRKK